MLRNEIDMSFNYEPIRYGEIKEGNGGEINKNTQRYKMLSIATVNDKAIGDVLLRIGEKERCFNDKIIWDEDVFNTVTAKACYMRGVEKTNVSIQDIINAQTFPRDYIFIPHTFNNVSYICGMSVPPIMIKRIVTRLIESGVFDAPMRDAT